MTLWYLGKNKLYIRTPHTRLDTCTSLHHPASVFQYTSKLYLTMNVRWNNYSSIYPVWQTDKQTVRIRNVWKWFQTRMNPDSENKQLQIQELNIYNQVITTLKHWLTPLKHTHFWRLLQTVTRHNTVASWLSSHSALQTFSGLCLNFGDGWNRWGDCAMLHTHLASWMQKTYQGIEYSVTSFLMAEYGKYTMGLCLACLTIEFIFIVLRWKFILKSDIFWAYNHMHFVDFSVKVLLRFPVVFDKLVQFTRFRNICERIRIYTIARGTHCPRWQQL